MTRRALRALLLAVDLPDPHEFATAYVEHVTATPNAPSNVTIALQRWIKDGSLRSLTCCDPDHAYAA